MTSREIRKKFIEFFVNRGHIEIEPAKLVLENDPTTLFTSSGMQPLVPYLLGEAHPEGKRLVDSQPSFRAEDIEEVGDNRHTTFFEMLGNWSLGDYFKKEQLEYMWAFLTDEKEGLELKPEKLYVSVFGGEDGFSVNGKLNQLTPDVESANVWVRLFEKRGIVAEIANIATKDRPDIRNGRIFYYGVDKNWWSRSGTPSQMPIGEIGGPDSEIFYDFGEEHKFHENSSWKHEPCHPNCDCGRFLEIGNSVFIQYKKTGDKELEELLLRSVDFGGGLERLVAAVNNDPDIFNTDLYKPIIEAVKKVIGTQNEQNLFNLKVIADHMKASVFMIKDGVEPFNKLQGYVLRRLLRRIAVKMHLLMGGVRTINEFMAIAESVVDMYLGVYIDNKESLINRLHSVIASEVTKFANSLIRGMKELEKAQLNQLNELFAFNLYQTHGFPYEVVEELLQDKGVMLDRNKFDEILNMHKELSRKASSNIFKGGLAGHSETEIKYHTATHLLHQALRDVLGDQVFQKGSNITPERLRFDFSFDRKMTDEELKSVEDLVNEKIKEDLKVDRKFMSLTQAKDLNAIGLFDEKYDKSNVSIYAIGPKYVLDPSAKDKRERGGYYSLEFCGGPQVEHTGVIGGIKITKEEAVSEGVRRIRAELKV